MSDPGDMASPSAEFVQSFARGLSVIRSFSASARSQTLAEVARATGLPRATTRRLLHTLQHLGYVRALDGRFELTPKVLDIGYSYLSSLGMASIAVPYLEELRARLNESSSIAVLDDTDVLYVARVPGERIMTVSIGVGSRFPAFQTSLGRVLLAELDDADIIDRFERSDRTRTTPHTVTTAADLLEAVAAVRAQGWALLDQELEVGVRSVAAPLRQRDLVVAAVNVSTSAGRTALDELSATVLPALLETADAISTALGMQ